MTLGRRLLELRERAGISRDAALAAIDKGDHRPDTLRKVEDGDRSFTRFETTSLAKFYGASEEEIEHVRDLWNKASKPSEFATFGLPESVVTYLDLERAATAIRACHNLIIPGILQVPSYARRVFELGGDVDAAVIERRIQARLKRQERLRSSAQHQVELIAVISEEALARAEVAQLDALVEFAKLPNIEIRVISVGVGLHVGMLGDFTLLEFPPETVDKLVYLETAAGGQGNDSPRIVEHLADRFSRLRDLALAPNESQALIAEHQQQQMR